jgi:hypothetical protein
MAGINGVGRFGIRGYVSPSSSSIITNGLILNLDASNTGSYPGTGTTWTDLTGSGTIATLVNGTSYSSENGGTLVFDGINDNISINNGFGLDIGNTYTFSIWVKFNGYNTVLAGSEAFYDSGYAFYVANSNTMYTAAGMNYTSIDPNLTTNQWVCLVVVRNATSVTWYKNGVSLGSSSMITTASNVIKAIGAYRNASVPLNGKISSVTAYNRNLSASEILQNFNTTKTRFGF